MWSYVSKAAYSVSQCTLFLFPIPLMFMFPRPYCLGTLLSSLSLGDLLHSQGSMCPLRTHNCKPDLSAEFPPLPWDASWVFPLDRPLHTSNLTCPHSIFPPAGSLNLLPFIAIGTITSPGVYARNLADTDDLPLTFSLHYTLSRHSNAKNLDFRAILAMPATY